MSVVIIDGTCPERTLYAQHIATATGWDLVTVDPTNDNYFYYDYMDSGDNVIIDGFQIAHHARDWQHPRDRKNLAYCAAHLGNRIDISYTLVTNMMEFYVTAELDDIVNAGHLPRIILDSNGEAVAATDVGTVKQQDKSLTLSGYIPHQSFFHAERQRLLDLYGR